MTKKSRYPKPLSSADRCELHKYTVPFFTMPIHAVIKYQAELALAGIESTVLNGPPGVGKSFVVKHVIQDLESFVERTLEDPDSEPGRILSYPSATASGAKTALIDLYERMCGRMSAGARRRHTPTDMVEMCAREAKNRRFQWIVVGEAQAIAPHQLKLLLNVGDYAQEELGHPLCYFFVGNDPLRQNLVKIGQLGQRVATEISMHRWTADEIAPHWHEFHPHLHALRIDMGSAKWGSLTKKVFLKVEGNFRRLEKLLRNVNAFALWHGRWVDEGIVLDALEKLSGES